jgi:hypothetical protein
MKKQSLSERFIERHWHIDAVATMMYLPETPDMHRKTKSPTRADRAVDDR